MKRKMTVPKGLQTPPTFEHNCKPLHAGDQGLIATCNAHFGQKPVLRNEGITK